MREISESQVRLKPRGRGGNSGRSVSVIDDGKGRVIVHTELNGLPIWRETYDLPETPMSAEQQEEFLAFFGNGTIGDRVPNFPHPVFDEFRFVQLCIKNIASSKRKVSEKRKLINKEVGDFKAFCRRANIRYRFLWEKLELPTFAQKGFDNGR